MEILYRVGSKYFKFLNDTGVLVLIRQILLQVHIQFHLSRELGGLVSQRQINLLQGHDQLQLTQEVWGRIQLQSRLNMNS